MPACRTPDGRLYSRADGQGPTVILAHGRYSTHRCWFPQVPILARDHRVVTFDARGYGLSTLDEGASPSLLHHLGDLEALAGGQPVAVVGQSMGGFGALAHALAHPDDTWALVLTGSPAGIAHPDVQARLAAATLAREALAPEERTFRPAFRQAHPELVHFSTSELDASPTYPPSFLDPLFQGGGPTAAQCAQLRVPTLVLTGSHDALVPPPVAEAVAAVLPGAELVIVDQAGHTAFLERPEAYNAAVTDFLTRHRP